jgi:hypothetical protein
MRGAFVHVGICKTGNSGPGARLRPAWCLAALLLCAGTAAAQPPEPVGPYAVDVRGALARFKQDPSVAAGLDVPADSLPTRGLGLGAGVHFYPLRVRRVTLGFGGVVLVARDILMKTADASASVVAPTVTPRLSLLSPQLSLNFGTREGWSYISGGVGLARLTSERDDQPAADSRGRVRATHYGGGARWFTGPHLAFTFDLRFYTVNAGEPAATAPAYPRSRFMVISAGVSLR